MGFRDELKDKRKRPAFVNLVPRAEIPLKVLLRRCILCPMRGGVLGDEACNVRGGSITRLSWELWRIGTRRQVRGHG